MRLHALGPTAACPSCASQGLAFEREHGAGDVYRCRSRYCRAVSIHALEPVRRTGERRCGLRALGRRCATLRVGACCPPAPELGAAPADAFERHGLAWLKRKLGIPAADPSRDAELLARLRAPARIPGTDDEYDLAHDEQLVAPQRPYTEEEAARG